MLSKSVSFGGQAGLGLTKSKNTSSAIKLVGNGKSSTGNSAVEKATGNSAVADLAFRLPGSNAVNDGESAKKEAETKDALENQDKEKKSEDAGKASAKAVKDTDKITNKLKDKDAPKDKSNNNAVDNKVDDLSNEQKINDKANQGQVGNDMSNPIKPSEENASRLKDLFSNTDKLIQPSDPETAAKNFGLTEPKEGASQEKFSPPVTPPGAGGTGGVGGTGGGGMGGTGVPGMGHGNGVGQGLGTDLGSQPQVEPFTTPEIHGTEGPQTGGGEQLVTQDTSENQDSFGSF